MILGLNKLLPQLADHTTRLLTNSPANEKVYKLALTTAPPSIGMIAPVTYSPPRPLSHKQTAPMSSDLPILPNGIPPSMASLCWSNVAFIIFDSKGPGAMQLTQMLRFPSWAASTRVR